MRAGTIRVDVVACALLIAGFATKAGLVPFHTWLPDAHSAAPGTVGAVFSGLMVTLGIVGLVRTALLVVGAHAVPVLGVLSALGVASGLVGAVAALGQDELKRLLAYDTVSQMGIVIVAFATGTKVGVAAGTLHLVNHAMFKSLLFLCTSAIIHVSGTDTISELGGMARRQPAIAAAFIVGVAALVGVPPLNGYASASLLETDLRAHAPLVYAGVLATEILTIAALARATWLVFFRTQPRPARTDRGPNAGMLVGFGLLSVLSITFGVVAPLLVHTVGRAASAALLAPAHTSATILGARSRVPAPTIPYEFVTLIDVVTVVGMLAAGIAIAVWILRRGVPAPVRWIRAVHTGRVQDDAAALLAGFVLVVLAVALAR
jgi:multicomponent Na+:H+ antiporter subunit D